MAYKNFAQGEKHTIFAHKECVTRRTLVKLATCRRELRNFERDGGRSTAYGVQAQFANHFVRLEGKLTGRERQMEG